MTDREALADLRDVLDGRERRGGASGTARGDRTQGALTSQLRHYPWHDRPRWV
ncbi:hypothetical protein [Nonomuraea dietziae]|uniref:hypothetical protein n=1 Tax=Nonomuraea dietziae TaxID=65515 RepID=UPI0031D4CD56